MRRNNLCKKAPQQHTILANLAPKNHLSCSALANQEMCILYLKTQLLLFFEDMPKNDKKQELRNNSMFKQEQ